MRVDGGALWEDVDTAAWKHHLAVVGGTVVDTGVGGLTLGGGIGWLSGLRGFTCDNLVRAEMVTAAGEKVVAGPDGDPDLLWALRGGGGNFGVVTAFEFEAIDPGPILAGYIHYPISAVKQVLRQLASMAESAPGALELTAQIGPHEEVGPRSVGPRRRLLAGRHRSRDRHPATAPEPLCRRSPTPSRRWSIPTSRT